MSGQLSPFDHNRLLKAVAGEVLEPHGLYQIGRSRQWVDDHGWWAIPVGFDPGRGRGSYLYVAVTLLWTPFPGGSGLPYEMDGKSTWKHPMGRFDSAFIEARRADWWERDVRIFANGALEYLETLRRRPNDVRSLLERLGPSDRFWDRYHRAVATGLLGERDAPWRGFQSVIEEADAAAEGWMLEVKAAALELQGALGDARAFSDAVAQIVGQRRARAKMRTLDHDQLMRMVRESI